MSKTTKIIAALGVVAGLGVAALPAFTFAVSPITGDVEVQVEVQPAIAMTIEGNNDNGAHKAKAFVAETVEVGTTDVTGMYEYDSDTGEYTETEDTLAESGKTYYSPNYHTVRNYSPAPLDNGTHIGDYVVAQGDPILGTSSSYAQMLPGAVYNGLWTASGSSENQFGSKITVYTNNTSGYTLTLLDGDTDTALNKLDDSDEIPAGIPESGETTFDLTAGSAAWGYKVNASTAEDEGYSAVPASNLTPAEIDRSGTATSGGRTAYVTYGVATDYDQATGIYADTIVYTATCN